jgi:hypothetical protein
MFEYMEHYEQDIFGLTYRICFSSLVVLFNVFLPCGCQYVHWSGTYLHLMLAPSVYLINSMIDMEWRAESNDATKIRTQLLWGQSIGARGVTVSNQVITRPIRRVENTLLGTHRLQNILYWLIDYSSLGGSIWYCGLVRCWPGFDGLSRR